MILAAGLTPAWQQIVQLDDLRLGDVNRARQVVWCASGKVLNVAAAVQACGGNVTTVCPVGGHHRLAIEREFASRGITARWIDTQTPTRVCTTLLAPPQQSGQNDPEPVVTEIVENAAEVEPQALAAFSSAYAELAGSAAVVVLSGSLPKGTPAEFYHDLIATTPGRVILDARGEELKRALSQRPEVVKPNVTELAATVARPLRTSSAIWKAMDEVVELGALNVIVTRGANGLLATNGRQRWTAAALTVSCQNPIGCGDSFSAGLAVALADKQDLPTALKLATAAAAANAEMVSPASFHLERVQQLCREVQVREI